MATARVIMATITLMQSAVRSWVRLCIGHTFELEELVMNKDKRIKELEEDVDTSLAAHDAEVIEQMLSNMLYEKGMTASHYK
jgi:hypothetical protein